MQTGNARLGYPSMGSWVIYGLGTENQNLPGFIVLVSGGNQPDGGKQLWGSGFLPSVYQGVQCRSHGEPVLYLENPPDVSRPLRRRMLDAVDEINRQTYAEFGNPETVTRIAQYEMAFRMQMDATDAMDIHKESAAVLAAYGAKPGGVQFRQQLCGGAPPGGTRRALYSALSLGMGRPRDFSQRCAEHRLRRPLPRNRSAHRGAAHRPEGTRHARGYAGRVGRGIRAHLHAGKPQRTGDAVYRQGPQSRRFHYLDGRAAASSPA